MPVKVKQINEYLFSDTVRMCRVMGRIINTQLLNYLELNKLISKEQHGFS